MAHNSLITDLGLIFAKAKVVFSFEPTKIFGVFVAIQPLFLRLIVRYSCATVFGVFGSWYKHLLVAVFSLNSWSCWGNMSSKPLIAMESILLWTIVHSPSYYSSAGLGL